MKTVRKTTPKLPFEVPAPVQQALQAFVNGLVGRELRVDYAWAGIFGMVMDFLPVVGRVPGLENVWVAGGYSGHGNVLGFACGELVAGAITGGGEPFADAFDPAAFPAVAHPLPPGGDQPPSPADQAEVRRVQQAALDAVYPENGFAPEDPRLTPVGMPLAPRP